ncbi:Histidine kinase [Vibrio jasicida]|uniref:histidine kinase n=2 Tax=Vibrio TaxID=662 RepID=A0AAU9QKE1_9VIBR|nr:two-component sensor histidine kinase [Vibrio vulnificus]CAH1582304.1 Histidine kinase [Vibrio jasicida]CAH1590811.1 Histidine kinase [Vibrio jasicida]
MLLKFSSLSLITKLFISTLVVSLTIYFLLAISLNNTFRIGLQNYFNESELKEVRLLAEKLSSVYSEESGWDILRKDRNTWFQLLEKIGEHTTPPVEALNGLEPEQDQLPDIEHENLITTAFIPLGMRLNVLDLEGQIIKGRPENIKIANLNRNIKLSKIDILYNGNIVGYVTAAQSDLITAPLAEEFFNLQRSKMYFVVTLMFFVNFLCCAYLLKVYLLPLKQVEAAGKELMKGNFDYEIRINSKDEIGNLSDTYNALTLFLKQEKAKRDQWITDIAHELRTPIQVLSSQVEAIQDGICEPDDQNMSSLAVQIEVLRGLVEDLYTLSLTDEKANIVCDVSVDLTDLITSTITTKYQQFSQKNINVVRVYKNNYPCMVKADPKSLMRVFSNIMENTIRYTDKGGDFRVTLDCTESNAVIKFDDSSPGVPDESLNKIFDRLYRVEQSRSRANGGAGLGLPICKNIIAFHNGTMTSCHSSLGGLNLTITIPLDKQMETNA